MFWNCDEGYSVNILKATACAEPLCQELELKGLRLSSILQHIASKKVFFSVANSPVTSPDPPSAEVST